MPPILVGLLVVAALLVLLVVLLSRKAGPERLDDLDLARARAVHRVSADEPGDGWSELGSRTTARGLDLRFDHEDDPEAEASLLVPPGVRTGSGSRMARGRTVHLSADYTEEHVHNQGWVFRLSLRGTGAVVGRKVKIRMSVGGDGRPWGGVVENDEDDDPAVGDWIEVAWAEVLEAPPTG